MLLMRFGLKEAFLERKLLPLLRSAFRKGIVEGNDLAPRTVLCASLAAGMIEHIIEDIHAV